MIGRLCSTWRKLLIFLLMVCFFLFKGGGVLRGGVGFEVVDKLKEGNPVYWIVSFSIIYQPVIVSF